MSVTIESGAPADVPEDVLNAFAGLVVRFGEVASVGLRKRIAEADRLVWARAGDRLVGAAALKNPRDRYRARVAREAGAAIPREAYPLELGWIAVDEAFRDRKLASGLVAEALGVSGGRGVMATTREGNARMLHVLEAVGFERRGQPYASSRHPGEAVLLLVRPAVDAPT